MAVEHILIAAIMANNSRHPENTRGHLTTREMYAVQPEHSVVKTLLSKTKDRLARQ
jgi:hypothetical protein